MLRCGVLPTLAALAPLAPLAAQHHGLDPANIDTTCRPCTDFNRYANGGWLARTQLDAQHASYGSFTELSERNQETLRGIVEQPAATAPAYARTHDEKGGALYPSCLDPPTAQATAAKPLAPAPPRRAPGAQTTH